MEKIESSDTCVSSPERDASYETPDAAVSSSDTNSVNGEMSTSDTISVNEELSCVDGLTYTSSTISSDEEGKNI